MKIAHNSVGEPIAAAADAPDQAHCPFCGGSVILRSRKMMNGKEKTYFWRHVRLDDLNCSGRSYPYRLKGHSASEES